MFSKLASLLSFGITCHIPQMIVTSLEVGRGKEKQKIIKAAKIFPFLKSLFVLEKKFLKTQKTSYLLFLSLSYDVAISCCSGG